VLHISAGFGDALVQHHRSLFDAFNALDTLFAPKFRLFIRSTNSQLSAAENELEQAREK